MEKPWNEEKFEEEEGMDVLWNENIYTHNDLLEILFLATSRAPPLDSIR